MSISASFDIKLAEEILTPIKVIQKLVEYGWTFDDDGQISYLPLGDDDYNWKKDNLDINSLMKTLNQKQQNKEVIGVIMTWQRTNIGGQFLVWNDGTILINLTVNRKVLENKITDINWYTTKLLPAFNQNKTVIENFSYQEHV